MSTLQIDGLGGACPVQGEGTLDGLPWYFRARGARWSFVVAARADGDVVAASLAREPAAYFRQETYDPDGSGVSAGYMDLDVAHAIIQRCAAEYAALRGDPTPLIDLTWSLWRAAGGVPSQGENGNGS